MCIQTFSIPQKKKKNKYLHNKSLPCNVMMCQVKEVHSVAPGQETVFTALLISEVITLAVVQQCIKYLWLFSLFCWNCRQACVRSFLFIDFFFRAEWISIKRSCLLHCEHHCPHFNPSYSVISFFRRHCSCIRTMLCRNRWILILLVAHFS